MKRSKSVRTGRGGVCPTCRSAMDRFEHEAGWKPRPGQPYHFRHWDRCGCGHLQYYEDAKVYSGPVPRPHHPRQDLTPDQIRASRALKDRCRMMTSKMRRRWLAEQMGIEERFAIISQFDAVECQTVLEICSEPQKTKRRSAA